MVSENKFKIFLFYFKLLVHESNRLIKNIKNEFAEKLNKRILLRKKDSKLFNYFIKYLYRS